MAILLTSYTWTWQKHSTLYRPRGCFRSWRHMASEGRFCGGFGDSGVPIGEAAAGHRRRLSVRMGTSTQRCSPGLRPSSAVVYLIHERFAGHVELWNRSLLTTASCTDPSATLPIPRSAGGPERRRSRRRSLGRQVAADIQC